MEPTEKFCLRWNDFETNITGSFKELREDQDFFDVTLACADGQMQAHKLILSACSPFFRTILRRNRHEHPLLYLKGVKYVDCISVLNFMYHGEVNVAKDELSSFLAVAEDLKVKGLTQEGSESDRMPMDVTQETMKAVTMTDKLTNLSSSNQSNPLPPKFPRLSQNNYESRKEDDIDEAVNVKPEDMVEDYDDYTVEGVATCMVDDTTENSEEHEGFVIEGPVDEDGVGGITTEYGQQLGQPDTSAGMFTEGRDTLLPPGGKISEEDSVAGDVDIRLEQHISRQLGPDRTDYVCLLCSKYCKSRDECANHIEVHHLKIVRTCPYCAIEQTSRGGLRQHISRKHREEHKLAKANPNFKPRFENPIEYNFQ